MKKRQELKKTSLTRAPAANVRSWSLKVDCTRALVARIASAQDCDVCDWNWSLARLLWAKELWGSESTESCEIRFPLQDQVQIFFSFRQKFWVGSFYDCSEIAHSLKLLSILSLLPRTSQHHLGKGRKVHCTWHLTSNATPKLRPCTSIKSEKVSYADVRTEQLGFLAPSDPVWPPLLDFSLDGETLDFRAQGRRFFGNRVRGSESGFLVETRPWMIVNAMLIFELFCQPSLCYACQMCLPAL